MVQLDTRLPLAIQQPNVLAALDAGTTAASNQANVMRQAEGQNLFRQYGAGAMQGDPTAMNALAGFDPMMAQGMQSERLNQDSTRLTMDLTRERIADVRRQAAEAARTQNDAAAAAAEAAQSRQLMTVAGRAFLSGDKVSFDKVAQEFGVPGLPMDERGLAFLDAVVSGFDEGLAGIAQTAKPGFRNATPDEAAQYGAAAGQFGPDGRFYPINPPSGMELIQNADGSTTFRQGSGVGGKTVDPTNPTIGQVYNPGEVASTIALIDEIFVDPSLPRITGTIQGGGGNDPDALNMAQRLMAGEQGMGTIAKINQVASRGWLAARDMLKGGGPITDYESRKAEAAVARLTRAQSVEDFQAALKDFRDAVTEGMMKLEQAGQIPAGSVAQLPAPPWTQDVQTQTPTNANRRGGQPAQQGATDFSTMSADDLLSVDETTLSIEELRAYSQRLDQIAAERRGR